MPPHMPPPISASAKRGSVMASLPASAAPRMKTDDDQRHDGAGDRVIEPVALAQNFGKQDRRDRRQEGEIGDEQRDERDRKDDRAHHDGRRLVGREAKRSQASRHAGTRSPPAMRWRSRQGSARSGRDRRGRGSCVSNRRAAFLMPRRALHIIMASSASRSVLRMRSDSDLSWPQAARMSRPRGVRIGEA